MAPKKLFLVSQWEKGNVEFSEAKSQKKGRTQTGNIWVDNASDPELIKDIYSQIQEAHSK